MKYARAFNDSPCQLCDLVKFGTLPRVKGGPGQRSPCSVAELSDNCDSGIKLKFFTFTGNFLG